MTELQTDGQPIKPLSMAQAIKRDELALKSLTGLINNPEFVEGNSEGDSGKFSRPPSEPLPNLTELKPHPQTVRTIITRDVPAPAAAETPVVWPDKVFTTGRLNAGKDFFLKSIGKTIHGFADPLYKIQKAFFGTDDKTLPGAREFLQKTGQWGRGTVSAQYPLTTERAVFTTLICAMDGELGMSVKWPEFGKSDSIWVDALLARTAGLDNVGVSNVRFRNELDALTAAGFMSVHIMASPATLQRRWKENKISPAATTDISEHLAIALDKAALAAGAKAGGKLRVIWSDKQVKSPSPRFITL